MAGTVSLRLDQPEDAPHRADLTELLVHRDFRGRGLASRLMAAVEGGAVRAGRTLLVLDTETGARRRACTSAGGGGGPGPSRATR
ncbi:GNAT family N-acetyltransferase [Kineococcus sp. NBC_00420]|uniref:GNAT family N-acetyltransferase n=1 Tax=Kineococcus sp. NBC_00420 TaxID=2903564 RepID=UPI002E1CD115